MNSVATEELAAELAGRLGDLTHALRRTVDHAASPTVTAVLATLDRDGAKRVSELAEVARVAQPTMTALLRRLVEDGTVVRGADPHDQRVVTIELTEAGRDTLRSVRQQRTAALASRLDQLDGSDRAALAQAIPALDKLLLTWRKVDHK
ncbi:MarR family transcriptional regulator [Actinocatenispora thailandica]|uniref:MarR family transcriptional regulator n=2 Tax=Actinocatenispora thailandica TaxID=227318 RepID=A0A7R7DPL8_9ACTN|nr:MarR family transcriptional regulator [Actinocatenispora thailandica]